MFTLHCTQKLRDRIKAAFASPEPSDTLQGNWYATAIFWKPQVALLVSEGTQQATGRAAVVGFFAAIRTKPKPIPVRLSAPVVQVLAQGDYVVVVTVSTLPDPRTPGKPYTTSWFDMWRFVDGKADEHWDSATLMPPPPR
ncbi:nuclear transport factor 2 family protein [Novosphingobium humi]|uniref:Nuclear transport factor 2 family protein n=1 Tax=Novosphingobium humi TaxID=2282397 RepID=A0ABY7U231_9SPHN|nr:nuclear transport factor 2 family protein [Novosphingobium humi]WCT79185.1 nuclear transport factor 2 family protein [Novosphingobium humi]